MSKTKADLAALVLKKLAIIDAADDVDATDEADVIAVYEDKWAEMTAHGAEMTYWKRDSIPDAVFLTLGDLIALEVRGHFGMPISAQDRESEEVAILRRLRRHMAVQNTGKSAKASYY